MKILLVSLTLAALALAQDNPTASKKEESVKVLPPTEKEKNALFASQRDALAAQNALSASMISYYEAQTKAKAAVEKWNADLQVASKKAGCQLDEHFDCQPVQSGQNHTPAK